MTEMKAVMERLRGALEYADIGGETTDVRTADLLTLLNAYDEAMKAGQTVVECTDLMHVWRERAEKAEARVAELEAVPRTVAEHLMSQYERTLLRRAEKAEARVAELERKLGDDFGVYFRMLSATTEKERDEARARVAELEAQVAAARAFIEDDTCRHDDEKRAILRTMDEARVWRCFICDEVFTTESDARDHFTDGYEQPGCVDPLTKDEKLRLKELRDAREVARRWLLEKEAAESSARAQSDHVAQYKAEAARLEKQRDTAEHWQHVVAEALGAEREVQSKAGTYRVPLGLEETLAIIKKLKEKP